MEAVSLAHFRGKKHVVLYFYPKDGTPMCIMQATDFSDHEEDFARYDCVVIGVSPDDCLSHAEFRDANGVSLCLLSDSESKVSKRYGVLQEKEVDGVRKSGIVRSTFIIDKRGVVRHALYNVSPKGHAAEVFGMVKELR